MKRSFFLRISPSLKGALDSASFAHNLLLGVEIVGGASLLPLLTTVLGFSGLFLIAKVADGNPFFGDSTTLKLLIEFLSFYID